MTRLTETDIIDVVDYLKKLDDELKTACNASFKNIVMRASGIDETSFKSLKTSVVPITSGLGIIGGFSHAVCEILKYIGADAYVCDSTDVDGIYNSIKEGHCFFSADDNRFTAYNPLNGRISDNGDATGRGFAAALELAANGIKDKTVLVAGAGPVGISAAKYLHKAGAEIILFDIDKEKLQNSEYRTCTSIGDEKYSYVLEATTTSKVITEKNLTDTAVVSAPGMPLGLEKKLAQRLKSEGRLIHNPLELGTAVMYTDLLLKQEF